MAELEVSISYRNTPARVGVWVMGALMPLWAIAIPFCLGLFLALLYRQGSEVPAIACALVLFVLVSIPVISLLISAVCEDDQLLVSKEGLSFPLMMLSLLGFRKERLWTDLSEANLYLSDKLSPHKENIPDGILDLHFKSGGTAKLSLRQMARADLEQLLLGLEVWGQNCKRSPELIAFHNQLQNENMGLDKISYTHLWEEELSRRFSATAFVPLEPEHKLKEGKLRVVRQLAFGGLSAIYLAQEDERDLVVIKEAVVPSNADEQTRDKAVELFRREAQFLVRLTHPRIARVFDHFQEEGRNYLLLEYVRGQDLRQIVKQHGPQPEAVVVKWAKQIAEILDYLHTQSPPIIHRDLTPDNLVQREDESITLIDFGAANEFVGTATGTLVGKQAYIAPEQLRGKATTLSDIYAFGGTLYYLLTGVDPEALSESHPKEKISSITGRMDDLIARCTRMEESERPRSAKEIIAILGEMIDQKKEACSTTAMPGRDQVA
ncbi:MAG TPA: serine/threonine-protein kinase [Candidatus Obscuribacterales bacterium]